MLQIYSTILSGYLQAMPKVIQSSELDYRKNEQRHKDDFLHVFGYTYVFHFIQPCHFGGCGQAHRGMPKVKPNTGFAIC